MPHPRVSSAVSVYFDAVEASCPSATRTPPAAGPGSAGGSSPGGSPWHRGGGSGGGSPFDVSMPQYTPQHKHHVYHQGASLAAVPSGDLGELQERRGGGAPRCCVIS